MTTILCVALYFIPLYLDFVKQKKIRANQRKTMIFPTFMPFCESTIKFSSVQDFEIGTKIPSKSWGLLTTSTITPYRYSLTFQHSFHEVFTHSVFRSPSSFPRHYQLYNAPPPIRSQNFSTVKLSPFPSLEAPHLSLHCGQSLPFVFASSELFCSPVKIILESNSPIP